MTRPTSLPALLRAIRACRECEPHLPLGPRPVVRLAAGARVLVVGQAPGTRVHATGIPWNDLSGDRLREWLAVDRNAFYDAARFAIAPMGLCYPGRGTGGDLPPRPECAPLWMDRIRAALPSIRLTLCIGRYAQAWFLGDACGHTLTDTVRDWRRHRPAYFVLPHPSPRNIGWLRRNPWFEAEVVPALRRAVRTALRRPCHARRSRARVAAVDDAQSGPPFRTVTEGDVLLVRMACPHLKLSQAQELDAAFNTPEAVGYKRVIFNLRGVTYIDSSGISLLVRIASGKKLRLVGLGPEVDRALRKMEMRELFSVHDSERAAMDSFRG